ncbi:MAG: prepilin-type N-terminal cleavage/methylation domain-containing protein [bacterium]|nr:prepilin-type N-terminal cleavage/methylation domain-containing protein [bacterium]
MKKQQAGVTLIELLIVAVLISLLLSASLPYFRNVTLEGQKTKVKTNLDTLRKAIEAYAAAPRTNGMSKFPDATDLGNQGNYTGPRAEGTGWQTTHLMVQYTSPAANPLGTTGPIMAPTELLDPFCPAGTSLEYGYYVNTRGYYIIWSNGLNRVNINCTVSLAGVINAPGSAIYVTNAQ